MFAVLRLMWQHPRVFLDAFGQGPWPFVFLVSALGWGATIALQTGVSFTPLCVALGSDWLTQGKASLEALFYFISPGEILISWVIMVVAMMLPLWGDAIFHVWRSNLKKKRFYSVCLFVFGSFAIWVPAVILVLGIMMGVHLLLGHNALQYSFWLILVAVLIWQASPLKQYSLNNCHLRPGLAIFGGRWFRHQIWFGARQGIWCVATCGPLMILPFVAPTISAHFLLMLGTSVLLIIERFMAARPAKWRVPFS